MFKNSIERFSTHEMTLIQGRSTTRHEIKSDINTTKSLITQVKDSFMLMKLSPDNQSKLIRQTINEVLEKNKYNISPGETALLLGLSSANDLVVQGAIGSILEHSNMEFANEVLRLIASKTDPQGLLVRDQAGAPDLDQADAPDLDERMRNREKDIKYIKTVKDILSEVTNCGLKGLKVVG